MDERLKGRLRSEKAEAKIITAEKAADLIPNGSVVGISGFTSVGYPKVIPAALAKKEGASDITIYAGASVGPEVDTLLTESGVMSRRYPYQTNSAIRSAINSGKVQYVDMHLGKSGELVQLGFMKKVDIALIEALAITEEGHLIPTTSVGNSNEFVMSADKVIVELAMAKPMDLEGMSDVYTVDTPPNRQPIPITHPGDRIGTPYIECGWDKIEGIVISEAVDKTRPFTEIDENAKKISKFVIEFLEKEVAAGRMTDSLLPIQSGVGSVANAVLAGLKESRFKDLTCYTEVIQDSMLELIKCGKVDVASCTAIAPSPEAQEEFFKDIDIYKDKIIFRPQIVSNSGEVAHRLGLIAMNTALEVDIYGNVNSTHVNGKKIMNGIGGSGDFSRNAQYVIFTTSSIAKKGAISSIVPMCSHIDHTEHEVQVIVTEQGYADLRGLSPKERAKAIIENCAHPDYKEQLMEYFESACAELNCHTPHKLSEALSWHSKAEKEGSMK